MSDHRASAEYRSRMLGTALERLEGGLRAFVSFLLEHDAYRSILLREGEP